MWAVEGTDSRVGSDGSSVGVETRMLLQKTRIGGFRVYYTVYKTSALVDSNTAECSIAGPFPELSGPSWLAHSPSLNRTDS